MSTVSPRLIVAWHGLPAYGVNAVRALCEEFGAANVLCVATWAPGILVNIENEVPCRVIIGKGEDAHLLEHVTLDSVRVILKTTWHIAAYEALVDRARSLLPRDRVSIVMLADNIFHPTLRKLFGPLIFRVFHLHRNDAVIVPGTRARCFMRAFGFRAERIGTGLYFADPSVFRPAPKGKVMVFVGQLNVRKGVPELMAAWPRFATSHPDWRLLVFGAGEWASRISGPGVEYRGTADSQRIAVELGRSHALLLPSRVDHWGVVLHEAALAGALPCGSVYAGATTDLLPNEYQDCAFKRITVDEIVLRLGKIADRWGNVDGEMLHSLAMQFTKEHFVRELIRVVGV